MKAQGRHGIITHRNFVSAEATVRNFLACSDGSDIIALVGCTRAGKSLIFDRLIKHLSDSTRVTEEGTIPHIHLSFATSNDGRVSPKYLALKLLKALKHPKYVHVGELDEARHYIPATGRDESSMRVALDAAMEGRKTTVTIIDEAHHLTHTANERVRANVLQSVKCVSDGNRTLVLVGGYELAYRGLFDSAHFAGRLSVVELPPYENNPTDLTEWAGILKRLSRHYPLSSNQLLLDQAVWLLEATNGSFGLLRKMIRRASDEANAHGRMVTRQVLNAHAPSKLENAIVRLDNERGREALDRFTGTKSLRLPSRSNTSKPFQRKPNRSLSDDPEAT
jgi:hypothetical protein